MKRLLLAFALLLVSIGALGAAPSTRAQYAHLLPPVGQMPGENTNIYYTNNSGGLASLRIYYNNQVREFYAYLYFNTTGKNGNGSIRYFEKMYNENGCWQFDERMQSYSFRQGKTSRLYIANDWTYIKLDGVTYNIPISKARFDQLVPRSSGNIGGNNGGGGYSNGGTNSGYQTGPSHIDKPCRVCGGGGGCSSCNGRGYKYNPYSGHDDVCPSCNGSRRCYNCRGTGKQATY